MKRPAPLPGEPNREHSPGCPRWVGKGTCAEWCKARRGGGTGGEGTLSAVFPSIRTEPLKTDSPWWCY